MSGERDDEDLERILDADELPDSDTDPLAALLHAAVPPATGPDPDRVLKGEEAAVAAFRAAFAPQPDKPTTPRRHPIRRSRTRTGAAAALSAVALLALAAIVLARAAAPNPQHSSSPTAPTTHMTPPTPSPGTSNSAALPLDDNATLTTAPHNSPPNSAHTTTTPSTTGHAHATKTPHVHGTHEHATKTARK